MIDHALELLLAQEEGDDAAVEYHTQALHAHNEAAYHAAQLRERNMRRWGQHPAPSKDMR